MNLNSKGCPVSKIVNSMEVQILVLARQDPVNDTYEATGEMYNSVIRHLLKGTNKERHTYDVHRGGGYQKSRRRDVQGTAERQAPGCVNAAGKTKHKW